jgi:hypothetical protein
LLEDDDWNVRMGAVRRLDEIGGVSAVEPLNYVRFLDYAAGRIFLRKVGGGYIFVHRLLLEYFASLEPEEEAG